MNVKQQIIDLENDWLSNPRWKGVVRPYHASDVVKLRPSISHAWRSKIMGLVTEKRACNSAGLSHR